MKRAILIILTIGIMSAAYFANKSAKKECVLNAGKAAQNMACIQTDKIIVKVEDGMKLLQARKDTEASAIFEQVLAIEPENTDALWGKSEILRRRRDFAQAEQILARILSKNPGHVSSLNSLAYIRYNSGQLNDSLKMINQILKSSSLDKNNEALAYLMLGAINSKRSTNGWLFTKIKYGTQIKCYFEKACEIAPELPETHLGIGTFYLKAPAIMGGNIDKAIKELELTVAIAPDFATACARLAQAYQKIGLEEKYKFYLARAKELDPENEALNENK